MGGWGKEWRDFQPGPRTPATSAEKIATDRGSRRGAKRCIVTEEGHILDHAMAKERGIQGDFFQSRKEAKFFLERRIWFRAGLIRPLPGKDRWRQVPFDLYAIRPDGLKERICKLVLDFAYQRSDGRIAAPSGWVSIYEDVKPGGGLREDAYLLKRKWFEAQYGVAIEEL